ncbi:MaoC family dehydratase [Mycobacterium asiaticum]|uniref:Acyl dehydratase n=1 Tax=Mycobacterium asiaticum TaxID=1790 RepID=A0A1A3MMC5_MYCAS|nr:MaoC family dehydratase [Mycobacterium asiaticum]OBK10190.1 acyl dehydratase [Mycobacterium asiaticum]
MAADLSYRYAFGTYEDALKMVGFRTEPRVAGTVVSGARIQHFAALVRDRNPAYWDQDFATQVWGGLVGPPGMLMSWLIPQPWSADGVRPAAALVIRVPLPGRTFVNASNEAEFLIPVVEGDRLSIVEEVVSVSAEKTTKLGVGHFVQTLDTFLRDDGAVVALNRNTLFRFNPREAAE